MSHKPVSPLTVVLFDPVAGSVSTIVAPATTAPVWSVTMPVRSELACANAPAHTNANTNGITNNRERIIILNKFI
jgi:hypothetical protein